MPTWNPCCRQRRRTQELRRVTGVLNTRMMEIEGRYRSASHSSGPGSVGQVDSSTLPGITQLPIFTLPTRTQAQVSSISAAPRPVWVTLSPHPAEPRHLLHCSVALALREGRLVHVFVGFSLLRMTHESQQLSHLRGDAGSCSGAQSRLTLCDPMDCSPPGSSVRGILQARTLEWVAMPSSRGPSPTRIECTNPQNGIRSASRRTKLRFSRALETYA